MDINATGAAQLKGAEAGNTSLSQLGEDYTRFLTLLTAQIENQDPLKPMDSTQFVSQLAQLSQVEQAVKSNSNLETLSAQLSGLSAVAGAGMIGRDVTVSSDKVVLDNGVSDGYFMVPEGAEQVSAEIRDPLDRVVRKLEALPTTAGELVPLGWDGTDDLGEEVLDGTYSVKLTAVDADGEQIPAYTYRKSSVKEVLFAEGQLYYGLPGDENVPADSVLSIR